MTSELGFMAAFSDLIVNCNAGKFCRVSSWGLSQVNNQDANELC